MSLRGFVLPLGLLLGATAAATSCSDPSAVGVDPRTPSLLASRPARQPGGDDGSDSAETADTSGGGENEDSLLSCRPLAYESVTQTIGPEGGVLEVRRNWLVIPRGALKEKVSITAVAPSDTLAMIRFQPEGLRFQQTAYLVAAYDNCRVKKAVTPRIAHVTDALDVIEFLPPVAAPFDDPRLTKVHRGPHHVIGELQHFSNYAVAW